ncbi:MAG: hypothetical protein B6I37_02340 [Desulfobacteraceae bacterium 4572_35.2]|nr:MAG: hypothetical protein B6I37_02340 [Desulfobacteraceae bacterium 4572_35.2]
MRDFLLTIAVTIVLSGCASFEEAYQLDQEFGEASQITWDQQVANPDYRYAESMPENLSGITAEEVMNVHNETFAEEPTEIDVFQLGVGTD